MIHDNKIFRALSIAAGLALGSCGAADAENSTPPTTKINASPVAEAPASPADPVSISEGTIPLPIGQCLNITLTVPNGKEAASALSICHGTEGGLVIERNEADPKVTVLLRGPEAAEKAPPAPLGGETGVLSQSVTVEGALRLTGGAALNKIGDGCTDRTVIYDRTRAGQADMLIIDSRSKR